MSLQENTTNLEEVLQKVRALPTASGTGGSLNKVLLGELNLNSSNLTVGTQPNSYNFGSNEQAIMSNILSKASSGNDIIAVEFYETSMGVNQIQMVSFFKMDSGLKGFGIDDTNGTIWFYENYVSTTGMYANFFGSTMNGNSQFSFKFYSLVGGSASTTSGSLNKVLLGEFELNSTNLTDEGSSSAPYYYSLGADVQAVMSSVYSKASLGNDVIIAELSCPLIGMDSVTPCEFNNSSEPTIGVFGSFQFSIAPDVIVTQNQNTAMLLSMISGGNLSMSVKFYALAGGSAGSDADLVIRVNNTMPNTKVDPSNVVIEKGDVRTILSTANGQNTFKCEVHYAAYNQNSYLTVCYVMPATIWCSGPYVIIDYVFNTGVTLFSGQIMFDGQNGNAISTQLGYLGMTPIE